MIRFTSENGTPICVAEVKNRLGVYLDNDSLIELAKGTTSRRQRFVDSLRRRGTLLFSLTNAAEIAGPQGTSADAVRAFLDTVGAYWVPLELNPYTVADREKEGLIDRAPISGEFMQAYFMRRANDLSPEGSKVLDLSETFFRLGAVLDWAQEERDKIRGDARRIDQALRDRVNQARVEYEKDPISLDRELPPIPFDTLRPATFVLIHLLRTMVVDAKAFQFKDNDGLDFCHSVLGASYGSLATLDTQWKHRVENLPKPNYLAKIFYRPEVDELVDLLELLVASTQGVG